MSGRPGRGHFGHPKRHEFRMQNGVDPLSQITSPSVIFCAEKLNSYLKITKMLVHITGNTSHVQEKNISLKQAVSQPIFYYCIISELSCVFLRLTCHLKHNDANVAMYSSL